MNKYTKPTFMLASLGVNALAAGSCSYIIDKDEKEMLETIYGEGAFFVDAVCNGNPVEGMCKFTSGEPDGAGLGAGAFSS